MYEGLGEQSYREAGKVSLQNSGEGPGREGGAGRCQWFHPQCHPLWSIVRTFNHPLTLFIKQ